MNQCERIEELLPLYADHELTVEEKTVVDEHVATCSHCMEELNLYQELADELKLDSIQVPKGFHDDLVSKLDLLPKKTKKSLYTRYNKYINVAAMLVFVIFLSVVGLTQANKWGQTSDETITMQTEMTMDTSAEVEESLESAKESTTASDSEAKAMMVEEEVMMVEEASEEVMMIEEASEEVMEESMEESETMVMDIMEVQEDSDESTNAVMEDVTEEDFSDGQYGESAEETESENTSDETFLASRSGSEENSIAEDKQETIELAADKESNQTIHTAKPVEESKTKVIVYIFIGFISLIVVGSGIYFIRKRKLKN